MNSDQASWAIRHALGEFLAELIDDGYDSIAARTRRARTQRQWRRLISPYAPHLVSWKSVKKGLMTTFLLPSCWSCRAMAKAVSIALLRFLQRNQLDCSMILQGGAVGKFCCLKTTINGGGSTVLVARPTPQFFPVSAFSSS